MADIREVGDSSSTPYSKMDKQGTSTGQSPARLSTAEIAARSKAAIEKRQKAIAAFLAEPRETQRKKVEDEWALLCYQLVQKASKYALNVTDKEFGKLSQLITSAAIAKDKVFHREDAKQPGNVVFNLFGNVGLDAIKKMLQPPLPTKIVNAKEITHEVPVTITLEPAPPDGVQHGVPDSQE